MGLRAPIAVHNNWEKSPKAWLAFRDLMNSYGNQMLVRDDKDQEYNSQTIRFLACADRNGVWVGEGEHKMLRPIANLVETDDSNVAVRPSRYGIREWEEHATSLNIEP